MKKAFFTLLIGASVANSFAQTSKALITSGNAASGSGAIAQIADFNPVSLDFTNIQNVSGGVFTVPRDFIYDAKNGHAIYQDKNNSLIFATISSNGIKTKTFNTKNTVIAPAYIPSSEEVVCFNVQKEFNGYGSNEENLFLSKIDVNKGTTKNLLKFNDLSFDNVAAPFYGAIKVMDRFTGLNVEKEVAISKPLYILEKDLYMVMVRDVTGTNRLYKINVNTGNVVSTRCNYNIIDMTYINGTDVAKTLYFEKTGSNYFLKVGDFNIITNVMTNISTVKNLIPDGNVIINNGSIKFNADNSQLYVSQYDGNKTNITSISVEDNTNSSTNNYYGYVQFDFGFNEAAYKKPSYSNYFSLYPNPSSNGIVNFKNNSGVQANSISVYDNVGQLVRFIKVEEIAPVIAIDLSEMANGIYHVAVDVQGQEFKGKVAVTK